MTNETAEQTEERIDIERAMARLTYRQHMAVVAFMEGLTQEETGEIMGIAQPCVKRLLDRAFAKLGGIKLT